MGLQDKLQAKPADKEVTSKAVEAEVAHIEALKQGIKCFRNLRLNRLILGSGRIVKPTEEDVFIAFSPEVADMLEYYNKLGTGLVEELTE